MNHSNPTSNSSLVRAAARSLFVVAALLVNSDAAEAVHGQKGAKRGLSREEVTEAEGRLSDLGYWAGEADGKWDAASRHALVAFQKVEGRERTGALNAAELKALRSASRPRALEGGPAHVEIDVSRQVLFFVSDEGVVTKILPVSTGSGGRYFDQGKWQRANTPRGRFIVARKIGGWRRSTLGLLYYPNYFSGGVAIHGSPSVPAYPASHGCIRVPMYAARGLSEMLPLGTLVIVHDGV